jgi:tetratricopeptide (TPR) repeat protein
MKKILSFIIISICACLPAGAMYMRPELQDLPLERLVANLEERAKAEPANADTLHQLARTHAMAYARKVGDADPVKAWSGNRGKDPVKPWFGFEAPHVPYNNVTPAADAKKMEVAKAHLAKAIEVYRKTLATKPDDTTIKLGLAWCQDQAGEKDAAKTLYREVAASAWEKESKSRGGLGKFLYVETVGYLIPLLDPAKDSAEIATMNERKEKLLSLPRAVTPLIVPLGDDDDIRSLVDRDARVRFDLDGTGRQLEWEWITNQAAWLVFDPKKSGKVSSAIQMFGSRSFLLFCQDGYQALSLLDDNRDGMITGRELEGLSLWRDTNSDGISDPGEVHPVTDYGIQALSTRGQQHGSGVPFCPIGVTFKDGTTRATYDVILH